MKEQGRNEKTRLVEISDPAAKNLDEAFQKMWEIAGCTACTKPLHHISINPMKDERLTDKQVMAIVERCEEKYGYKMFHHQRVIVEHVKDGRQHFHVIWNRVSLMSGSAVWPGHHWLKSKEVCREMEQELGLKSPTPRQNHKPRATNPNSKPRRQANIARASPSRRKPGSNIRPIRTTRLTTSAKPVPLPKLPLLQMPKEETVTASPSPMRPREPAKGWPLAAIIDWKTWGYKHPRRFFQIWWELAR